MDRIPPPKKDPTPLQALGMVWDIGVAIAVPTVLFAFGGRWLDQRWGTSPIFLVVGLFLSLAIAAVIVVRKGRAIAKRL